MAQPAKAKSASRWGSLLAGLESRLDNILAEEGTAAARNAEVERIRAEQKRTREVAASVRKDAIKNAASPAALSSAGVEPETANLDDLSVRSSIDSTVKDVAPTPAAEALSAQLDAIKKDSLSLDSSPRPSTDVADAMDTNAARKSVEAATSKASVDVESQPKTLEELVAEVKVLREDASKSEQQRLDEVHEYEERIDALQAKLKYLAEETVKNSKDILAQSEDGDSARLLAKKDEQIALLMEEGQKLSKLEVTQAGTIRKLRAKAAEDNKKFEEVKQTITKFEKASLEMVEKLRRADIEKKDVQMRINRLQRVDREVKELRADKEAKLAEIDSLKKSLQDAATNAEEERKKGLADALDSERKVAQSLREDLANAKIEQNLRDERTARDIRAAQEEVQREKERSKTAEMALRGEMSILEGRLEIMRERTEEVATGSIGDSHAKLMRQIETLQNQYSVASENWQGIESSLQARLTALQVEKDEASRLETEARRKARESGTNSRRVQEQLDETSQRCLAMEHELTERKAEADRLQGKANEFEKSLKDVRDELDRERTAWTSKLEARIEEERAKWEQESIKYPSVELASTIGSPTGFSSSKRQMSVDPPNYQSRRTMRQGSELSIHPVDRGPNGRRPSAINYRSSETMSPNGLYSGRSTPAVGYFAAGAEPPQTPSIHTNDDEQMETATSSPQRTINDMLSVSTAAAGPSVQLVERMSAAVRRLESEKAASKDELRRLATQRDEARKEVVNLMKELEEKRGTDKRLAKLEQELTQVSQRYHTTLEMLGEKSERVEELQADVADLKTMYRELVESTVKQ